MAVGTLHVPFALTTPMVEVIDFVRWLRTHSSAKVMAGLLAVASTLPFTAGALGISLEVTPALALAAGVRAATFIAIIFPVLLLSGYVYVRLRPSGWRVAVDALALGVCEATVVPAVAYFNAWADMLATVGSDPQKAGVITT